MPQGNHNIFIIFTSVWLGYVIRDFCPKWAFVHGVCPRAFCPKKICPTEKRSDWLASSEVRCSFYYQPNLSQLYCKKRLSNSGATQVNNHLSEMNSTLIIHWISDIVFNFYAVHILKTSIQRMFGLKFFSDQWFDFGCIWIQDSLFTVERLPSRQRNEER